jgi:hypothetical protein
LSEERAATRRKQSGKDREYVWARLRSRKSHPSEVTGDSVSRRPSIGGFLVDAFFPPSFSTSVATLSKPHQSLPFHHRSLCTSLSRADAFRRIKVVFSSTVQLSTAFHSLTSPFSVLASSQGSDVRSTALRRCPAIATSVPPLTFFEGTEVLTTERTKSHWRCLSPLSFSSSPSPSLLSRFSLPFDPYPSPSPPLQQCVSPSSPSSSRCSLQVLSRELTLSASSSPSAC